MRYSLLTAIGRILDTLTIPTLKFVFLSCAWALVFKFDIMYVCVIHCLR